MYGCPVGRRYRRHSVMSDMKLTREDLRNLVGLPMKIYGTLLYVSITPDGELVLYIGKNNKQKLNEIGKSLKDMEGREMYLLVDIGNWED